jgi:hypothetical protein
MTTTNAYVPPATRSTFVAGTHGDSTSDSAAPSMLRERLGDAGLLVLVWLALPVAILVVGSPVALVARLVIALASR